jgi:hypothetical protein
LQGRRSCTVPFKTAPCRFFFLKKRKKKIGSYPKIGYDNKHVMLTSRYFCLLRYSFFCVLFLKLFFFLFWPLVYGWLELSFLFCLDLYFMGLSRPHAPTSCPRSQVSQVNHDWSRSS